MRSQRYQMALICLGFVVTALFGYYFYREIFPEYRIYQNDYVALEDFRSTYTHEPPPEFKAGVKRIVFEREDKGPARVDRCISCHVALQLQHFSPTQIAHDVNGNIIRTPDGKPQQEPNENYVWGKLEQKIADLKDEKVNAQLTEEGQTAKVKSRLKEAEQLAALKTAEVGEHVFDVTKVLAMHPLIGKETRPFEFHPLDDYGCTSCHSGNGRGLTTEKAHGPVFDGHYEAEYMGPTPQFTEKDAANDPEFSRVFNAKPGDALLFQTTPILVGNLIQASCIQCHKQSSVALQGLADSADVLAGQRKKSFDAIKQGYDNEKEALLALLALKQLVAADGVDGSITSLAQKLKDPATLPMVREKLTGQVAFLQKTRGHIAGEAKQKVQAAIEQQLEGMLGSKALVVEAEKALVGKGDLKAALDDFIKEQHTAQGAVGSLFDKWEVYNLQQAMMSHVEDTQQALTNAVSDDTTVAAMTSDVDWLTKNYQRGQQLYISQACYACHRISGLTRGGVGPELTRAGDSYPWFMKRKLVWPQGDLKTSTMPNFMLDSVELEDLMTFLLAQKGPTKAVSETDYKVAIQQWEAGRKMPWEQPLPPSKVHDLRYSMTVFATQGCASCHRLEGYDSNVGYRIEKEGQPDFEKLYLEKTWFKNLFPEEMRGSAIVRVIEEHADEIDKHLVADVRQGALLEEIEQRYPESVEGLYANFRFAARAKDHYYQKIADGADEAKKKDAMAQLTAWKSRVQRILMMYVQEYGLGRLIGPRPNWSGVYRSDEWLMEHFHNPAGHVPRSIMPIMPFDDSKFFALTYMLDVLGKRNRDAVRDIWQHKGFDPEQAYHIHCSQCHGDYLQGDGPVATWIYPIPKNLRNAEFLRNLTKENAIQSITHGVKGTPMAPWGETPPNKESYDGIPVLTSDEIGKLVDWLYTSLPGGTIIRGHEDVPKWNYTPEDVLHELQREGSKLDTGVPYEKRESGDRPGNKPVKVGTSRQNLPAELKALAQGEEYFASLEPVVYVAPAKPEQLEVEDVFDKLPNPVAGGDKYAYYIKPRYYTEQNVEQGKHFFNINCAVCHGNDADGTGARSSIMTDAKPRMLTNLDWINTRDDLRLLRSIKYGVPGTAMTPWGDFTSSLQRMQLVMYIRSLSFDKKVREVFMEALYKAFDEPAIELENKRIAEYAAVDALQNKYSEIQKRQRTAFAEAQEDAKAVKAATALYQQQLEIGEELKQRQMQDEQYVDLRKLMEKERDIFQGIGNDMISANLSGEPIWQHYLKMVALNGQHIDVADGKLSLKDDVEAEKQSAELAKQIVNILDAKSAALENEKVIVAGKLPSSDRDTAMHQLSTQAATYNKIKARLLTGMEQVVLMRNEVKPKKIMN